MKIIRDYKAAKSEDLINSGSSSANGIISDVPESIDYQSGSTLISIISLTESASRFWFQNDPAGICTAYLMGKY